MKKLHGLPAQLDSYLHRAGRWLSKGELTADIVWKHQRGKYAGARYLPETVGRALRSLEEQRYIAVKDFGISVVYKWLPPHMRAIYLPPSERRSGKNGQIFGEGQAEGTELVISSPYKE